MSGVGFLTFTILICMKAVTKLIGNCFFTPIVFLNPVKKEKYTVSIGNNFYIIKKRL